MRRDTVSAIGILRRKILPGTLTGMKYVCFFRHALALDERRVKFIPEYAYEEDPPAASNGNSHTMHGALHTKEVWFAGSHSDMYV